MASVIWIARLEEVEWWRTLTFVTWGDFDNAVKERAVIGLGSAANDLPGWLASRMRDGGVELPSSTSTGGSSTARVVLEGVAQLTARGIQTHQGPTTDWDSEGRLLLQMYNAPMDACKIKVLDAFRLKNPIPITHREQHDRKNIRNNRDTDIPGSRAGTKKVEMKHDIWIPILPSNADLTLENNRSVQDQMARWRAQGDHKYVLLFLSLHPRA